MSSIYSSERSTDAQQAPAPRSPAAQDVKSTAPVLPADGPLAALQRRANGSAVVDQLAQWSGRGVAQQQAGGAPREAAQGSASGGLPTGLRSNMEALSGTDMSAVKVHYNSPEPQKMGALAYAQGQDIHLGSGQEKHLPHEAWHVVQQAQGRVKPTRQLKGAVAINDDAGLEKEADVMGARAMSMSAQGAAQAKAGRRGLMSGTAVSAPSQRVAAEPAFWTPTAGLMQLMSAGGAGAQAAPVLQALDGMTLATMTPAAYGCWQGTAQCKAAPHAAVTVGNRTLVTQYKDPQQVIQRISWPSWSSKTLDRIKGALVAMEGVLTFGVSLAAGVLTGGVGTIPAILGMVVGAVKFGRGILMAIEVSEENKGKKAAVVDVLRALEAAGALVGASQVDGFKKIPLLVFGIAKSFRSLLSMITDYMGADSEYPRLRKGLMMLASAAHYVESVALAISGLGASDLAGYLGAGVTAAVGASKAVRTGIQAGEALDAPSGTAPPATAATATPATPATSV